MEITLGQFGALMQILEYTTFSNPLRKAGMLSIFQR